MTISLALYIVLDNIHQYLQMVLNAFIFIFRGRINVCEFVVLLGPQPECCFNKYYE